MADSEGKVAVITGANRGLGLQVAKDLAIIGYNVVLTGRNPKALEDAVAQLAACKGVAAEKLHTVVVDVTKEKDSETLAAFVREKFNRLDTLVNNAGILPDNRELSAFESPASNIMDAFQINTVGSFIVTKALVPIMRKRGSGCIVFVSSAYGQLSGMGAKMPAYRISKTAMNALALIVASELEDTKIRVNAVSPGWVRTDMGGPQAHKSVEEGAEGLVWAATLPDDGPTGGFFRDNETLEW